MILGFDMGMQNSTVQVNPGSRKGIKLVPRRKLEFGAARKVSTLGSSSNPQTGSERDLAPNGLEFFGRISDLDIYRADDLLQIEPIWREFELRAASTPFQNFDWVNILLSQADHKKSPKPLLLFVMKQNKLCMIVPFAVQQRFGTTSLVWLGQDVNDYNAPLFDINWLAETPPSTLNLFWETLIASLENIDFVKLHKQPEYLGHHKNPFFGHKSTAFSSNAHFLKLEPDWKKLYSELRGSRSRSRLKGKLNKLGGEGSLSFRCARGQHAQDRVINRILAWKSLQLSERGAPNPFRNGDFERLFSAINRSATNNGFLRTYALFLDDRPIAGSIVLVHNGVMNLFVTSYEFGKWHRFSPGAILHVKLMELAARSGLANFDFLVGDENYKTEWAGEINHITSSIYGLTLPGHVYAAITKSLLNLKIFLKSHKQLLHLLFVINAHLGQGLRQIFGFEPTNLYDEEKPHPGKTVKTEAILGAGKTGRLSHVQK